MSINNHHQNRHPTFGQNGLPASLEDSHLGFQIPKNCHPHQYNRHHIHNSDSIPLLLQPMLHKQDISYYHLKYFL